MTKRFFIHVFSIAILSFTISSKVLAQTHILDCLGQEELRLHKEKKGGPIYFLNRNIINSFAELGRKVNIKSKYLNLICYQKNISPSLELLISLLEHKKTIFTSAKDSNHQLTIKKIISEAPATTLFFFEEIQKVAIWQNCLEYYVPGLTKLYERIKYLENETSLEVLFKREQSTIKNILERLKNFDNIFMKCIENKDREDKKNHERKLKNLRLKAKMESVPSDD